MGIEDKQLALSAFAWIFNVSTSVTIVFINKVLMGSTGYAFNFGAFQRARCQSDTRVWWTGSTFGSSWPLVVSRFELQAS